MDDKGFIFTVDSVLMLIPIFIIIVAVSNINITVPYESPYYNVQDALDTLYYSDVNASVVNNLSMGNIDAARYAANNLKVFKSFNAPYVLNYTINNGIEQNLVPLNSTVNSNAVVSCARKKNGNVTLILYMWR
ncbi:hypothetical protein [Methanobacterium oryzae]|uniref:hypothetical protein n=1 Tax=Methanobacterium oryzae TaxID=69540 RepID=UPI003D1A23B7